MVVCSQSTDGSYESAYRCMDWTILLIQVRSVMKSLWVDAEINEFRVIDKELFTQMWCDYNYRCRIVSLN